MNSLAAISLILRHKQKRVPACKTSKDQLPSPATPTLVGQKKTTRLMSMETMAIWRVLQRTLSGSLVSRLETTLRT